MTDTQLFLCVVLLLYFSGRCLWRPARSIVFRSIFFRSYAAVFVPSVLGNRFGSVLLADPFVPLRPVYFVDLPEMLFAPEGVAIDRSEGATGFPTSLSWMRYEEIEAVERQERLVIVNGQMKVRCRTAAGAIALASRLEMLRHLPVRERTERIQTDMRQRFNLREAKHSLRQGRRELEELRMSCNLWLAGIGTAYGLMAAKFGYATMTLFLLVGMEAAAIHLGYKFYRAHRQIYPDEKRAGVAELIKFLCCAPTVFHSVDAISSELVARFHPLVVAHLVCGPREFDRFCVRWVRSFKYSNSVTDPNESWLRAQSGQLLTTFLKGINRPIERYLAGPERLDAASKSYCPRCEAQYQFADGLCADCAVAVVAFEAADAKSIPR